MKDHLCPFYGKTFFPWHSWLQRGMQQLHCVLAAAQFCRRAVSYRKRLDWLLLRKAQTTYLCDNVQQVVCHSYSTAKSKCVRELRCFRGVTSVQNPLNLISWIYTKLSFGPLKTKIKITSYYKVNTATVFTNSSLLQQRAQRLSLFFSNAAAGNDANDECEIDPKQ